MGFTQKVEMSKRAPRSPRCVHTNNTLIRLFVGQTIKDSYVKAKVCTTLERKSTYSSVIW